MGAVLAGRALRAALLLLSTFLTWPCQRDLQAKEHHVPSGVYSPLAPVSLFVGPRFLSLDVGHVKLSGSAFLTS